MRPAPVVGTVGCRDRHRARDVAEPGGNAQKAAWIAAFRASSCHSPFFIRTSPKAATPCIRSRTLAVPPLAPDLDLLGRATTSKVFAAAVLWASTADFSSCRALPRAASPTLAPHHHCIRFSRTVNTPSFRPVPRIADISSTNIMVYA